jgi:hypothetical protein
MTDSTLCGGCGVRIHRASTGGWLDEHTHQWWCWPGQRHYPMSVTQSIAKRALMEKEMWV